MLTNFYCNSEEIHNLDTFLLESLEILKENSILLLSDFLNEIFE